MNKIERSEVEEEEEAIGYGLVSAQDIYVHYTLSIIPSPATYHLVDIK